MSNWRLFLWSTLLTVFAVHYDEEFGLEELFLVLFVDHFGHHRSVVVVYFGSCGVGAQRNVFD